MTAIFELKQTTDNKYMFNLKAGNGQVILTSQRYTTRAAAENGIASVRENGGNDDRFDRLESSASQPYFVLKAANHEVIGTSEMYSSKSACENGTDSVKANAEHAVLEVASM